LNIYTCDGRNNGLVIMGSGLYYRSCNGIRPPFHTNFTFASEVWDLYTEVQSLIWYESGKSTPKVGDSYHETGSTSRSNFSSSAKTGLCYGYCAVRVSGPTSPLSGVAAVGFTGWRVQDRGEERRLWM